MMLALFFGSSGFNLSRVTATTGLSAGNATF